MSGTTFNHDGALIPSCAVQAQRPADPVHPLSAGRRQLRQAVADRAAA